MVKFYYALSLCHPELLCSERMCYDGMIVPRER